MSGELSWLRNLRYELCVACTHCLKSSDQCRRHRFVRCADDDCLSESLLPLRPEKQLNCRKNSARERIKICGLEKWLLVHEIERDERKVALGNREAAADPVPEGTVTGEVSGAAAYTRDGGDSTGVSKRKSLELGVLPWKVQCVSATRKEDSEEKRQLVNKYMSQKIDEMIRKECFDLSSYKGLEDFYQHLRGHLAFVDIKIQTSSSEKTAGSLLKRKESESPGSSPKHSKIMRNSMTKASPMEQLSSKDQDVSDKDIDDRDNDSNSDVDDGTNIYDDITKKQVPHSSIEERELKEPENLDEQEPVKKKIREDRVPGEGDTRNLQEAAALVTFYPGAIIKPLPITCSLCNPRDLSPPLGSDEVLVSNVIELSQNGPPELEFSGNGQGSVTVALMQSASNFRGYEIVIKQLVDPENNEWIDLVTNTFWHTSDKSTAPIWLFPFAEAACSITHCSSFAAIWRLKSFIFWKPKPVTAEFTCTVPDFPDVSVSIPWNSVPAKEDFCLTLKVQELPRIGSIGEGMLVGPVLHISSSHIVKHLEPAKITIPLTFFQGKRGLEDFLSGEWKILHNSREISQEWIESTDMLVMPPVLADGIVTFQVKHFCRILLWWLNVKKHFSQPSQLAWELVKRAMGQQAEFLACLCEKVMPSNYVLTITCYPSHLKDEVNKSMSRFCVKFEGLASSEEPLCNNDQAFVSFSEAFLLEQSGNTEDPCLWFHGNAPFHKSWPVTIRDPCNLQLEFFKSQNGQERRRSLCTLYIVPIAPVQGSSIEVSPVFVSDHVLEKGSAVKRKGESPGSSCVKHPKRTHAVKEGSPENDDLERLANQIINKWKELGRRLLKNEEALLDAVDKDCYKSSEKAYKMLLEWKAANGSDATFRILHDALCHDIVNRRDLAEKICLVTND